MKKLLVAIVLLSSMSSFGAEISKKKIMTLPNTEELTFRDVGTIMNPGAVEISLNGKKIKKVDGFSYYYPGELGTGNSLEIAYNTKLENLKDVNGEFDASTRLVIEFQMSGHFKIYALENSVEDSLLDSN